jgi:hypothetical protein
MVMFKINVFSFKTMTLKKISINSFGQSQKQRLPPHKKIHVGI